MNIFYFIFVLLLCSLVVSILLQSKEAENWLWPKVLVIYLCCFFSFNIHIIRIPVLIMIAFFIIKIKSKVNVNIKLTALAFSCILFISMNYVFPNVPLKQVYHLSKQETLENRFDRIKSSHSFSEDCNMQSILRRYGTYELTMFTVWIYDHNDIPIKDYEWLWRSSYDELDVYYSILYDNEKNYCEAYLRFNKTGQEYLGIFKKDKNGLNYLESVIEGSLKQAGRPKSIFNIY